MCDDVQERLSRCLRLVAHLICLGLRLEPLCQLQLRSMTKSQWMNSLRIEQIPMLHPRAKSRRSAQLCDIGAEALSELCFYIELIATSAHCLQLLILPKGKEEQV